MIHKTIAISRTAPDLRGFRAHTLHDHEAGVHYVIHWPRRLQEQLVFEALPGLVHLPHIEDQVTRLPAAAVELIPDHIGVTTDHNTYQALLRLHAHYQWDNFHPHQ